MTSEKSLVTYFFSGIALGLGFLAVCHLMMLIYDAGFRGGIHHAVKAGKLSEGNIIQFPAKKENREIKKTSDNDSPTESGN